LHDIRARRTGILAAPPALQNPPPEGPVHALDTAGAKPPGSVHSSSQSEVPSAHSKASRIPMQYLAIQSDNEHGHRATFSPMHPDTLDPLYSDHSDEVTSVISQVSCIPMHFLAVPPDLEPQHRHAFEPMHPDTLDPLYSDTSE
jgi:hypothetical protein